MTTRVITLWRVYVTSLTTESYTRGHFIWNLWNAEGSFQLENVFVKHYAHNHMPDSKGEWSLKGNNSELHYGNIQKLISSSTPWSVTICPISGSYPKQFFRYYVHKVVPIQNACVWKRGISQPKIFGIGSKVYQFIYTLVCYYMPNIRILAKLVLQIFCSPGCSNTKCLCLQKGE